MGKKVLLFGGSLLLGAIMGDAGYANALSYRSQAYSCVGYRADDIEANASGMASYDAGIADMYCAVPNDDRFPIDSVASLTVYGNRNAGTGSVYVYACTTYLTGGGACGSSGSTSSSGNFALSPALTYWGATYASDLPSIHVQFNGISGGVPSYVRGWVMTN